MAQGTIRYLSDRGFGFIDYGTGRDRFFHRSALEDITFDALQLGDRLEFDIVPDPRGLGDRAVHVRRVDAQPQL